MGNYSKENTCAIAGGEKVETENVVRRVRVGTITVFDHDQKYDVFSERGHAADDEIDALAALLVKEINSLLINEDIYPDQFVAAINRVIEDSGLAPKVVEKSTK